MLKWAWRHKRTIAATAVVGGATAYGAYYLYRKKRELEELVETLGLQQLLSGGEGAHDHSSTREERVREHFADMQREADRLLLDALPRLQEQVTSLLVTDALQDQLRAAGASAEPGRWHELKVLTISRLLTAQYALVLALLAVRIRLNIIGRHYLLEAQAVADGSRLDGALSKITKKRFLSMEHLLSDGLQPLQEQVLACVRSHLASELPSDADKENYFKALCTTHVTAQQTLDTLAPIRAELERGLTAENGGDPAADVSHNSLLRAFLIDEQTAAHGFIADGDQLSELLGEVRAIVGSAAFRITLDDLLEAAFTTVGEQLHQSTGGVRADTSATSVSLPRVKLLAKLKHLSTATLSGLEPYGISLLTVPSLEEFCWMVYSGD
mmetsp:Transcript_87/g.281  ORF Transcript_87/g.281 Transcript_87/m.281 type:complete len:383 (-) Transcript_87:372-1520(-)